MKTNPKRRILGISLIEALAALAVLAFGLLAIAKLHGDLVASTGLAKARAEAVQLAESRIEEMRNIVLREQYNALIDPILNPPTGAFDGVNANFIWTSTITDETDPDRVRIRVLVAWVDSKGTPQDVTVTSELGWNSPILTAATAAGPGAGLPPLPSPSGAARLGGDEDYQPNDVRLSDLTGNEIEGEPGIEDGTVTYQPDGPTGKRELIDIETGKVLLTIDDGSAFATIAGRVYIEGTSPAAATIRPLISANGYCAVTIPEDNKVPAGATGNNVKYTYLLYQCYVGHGWFGNVGVYRMAGTGPNDEICVGDPEVDPNLLDTTSKHPQLSIVRSFRGFYNTGNLNALNQPVYWSEGIEAGDSYADQHFLAVRITGQAADSDCLAQLRLDPTPYDPLDGGEFTGNTGKAVCLTASRASPYECPTPWPAGSPPVQVNSVTISGSLIDADKLADPEKAALDFSGVTVSANDTDCNVTEADGAYAYVCEVSYVGPGWTGIVEVDSGADLWANPRSYAFTELSVDTLGNHFWLTAQEPQFQKLTVAGTIKRPATNPKIAVNSVSIASATCTIGNWVDDSVTYDCTPVDLLEGSWSGLVTLGFGNVNQDVICAHSTAPAVQTTQEQLTIHLNAVNVESVILNISTKKTNEATCPPLPAP